LRVVVIAAPASLLVELLLWPIVGAAFVPGAVAWGAASGLASVAAFALLYRTLAIGPMSVLSPVTALVSAALPVSVGLIGGERLSAVAVGGMALALVAIVVVSGGTDTYGFRPSRTALTLAFGAGAAIALQLICLDQAPNDSGVAPLIVGRAVSSAVVLGAAFTLRSRLGDRRPSLPASAAAGALDSLANFAFLLAVREGDLAIVAVITALYPAGTVLLARTLLAERIAAGQLAGLGLAAVAVSLLAVG
jgi:drug/metabolite transporter (DMT)-like permease